MKNTKGFIPIIIILVVLIGFIGVYFYGTFQSKSIIESPTVSPVSTVDPTTNWKIYIGYLGNSGEIGYEVKYMPEIILSRGNCDSFILSLNESERKKLESVRNSGIEIGYEIGGLELAFCAMSNPRKLSVMEFAKQHTSDVIFESKDFNNYTSVKNENNRFSEYFVLSPNKEIIRIWYKFSDIKYKNIANQILSTFKFTN